MTGGEKAYNLLVETEANVEQLWIAAKEARMSPKDIELIRNYVSGLNTLREWWEAERSRWEPKEGLVDAQ
jgi:hypothetical protein